MSTLSTRTRLMDAARKMLAEVGADNLSMRSVARLAEVTPGAIYRHFADREQLIEAVTLEAFQALEFRLLKAISGLPVGSTERVAELGRQYIHVAQEFPEQFKILFAPANGVRRKISDLPGSAGFDLLVQCVEECIESGAMRAVDARSTALLLWTRVHGIVTLFLACDFSEELPELSGANAAQRFFESTHEFILHGLASDAS